MQYTVWMACAPFLLLAPLSLLKADELSDRFRVPRSLHVELSRSGNREVEGVTFDTIDDVVRFYEKHRSLEIDASEPSWDFLNELGLRLLDKPLPEPPKPQAGVIIQNPNAERKLHWIRAEVHIDGNRRSLSEIIGNSSELRSVRTEGGRASVRRRGQGKQITLQTGAEDTSGIKQLELDAAELFSRSQAWFEGEFTQKPSGDHVLYSFDRGRATQHFLGNPDQDSMLARATVLNATGKPHIIAFHFAHREVAEPWPHTIPTLTLLLQKTSKPDRWSCRVYFITKADLDQLIPPSAFFVPAQPGDTFFISHLGQQTMHSRPVDRFYPDILTQQPPVIMLERR